MAPVVDMLWQGRRKAAMIVVCGRNASLFFVKLDVQGCCQRYREIVSWTRELSRTIFACQSVAGRKMCSSFGQVFQ